MANTNGSPPNGAYTTSSKPKIVILGSGYAGAQCARTLQEKLGESMDLTVIEKRHVNIHKIAAARAAVVGNNYSDRVLVPNDNLLEAGKGRLLRESIQQVGQNEVKLANGQSLPFDYLVCATGSTNFSVCEPPLKYTNKESMKKFYDKVHKKIRSSERIVIIGGGPTGVELAGEIKYEYNSKVVTIVHSGERLLNNLSPMPSKSFSKKVRQRLEEIGIAVYTGQKLLLNWKEHGNKPYISTAGTEYTTDKGKKIAADLILLCAGKKISNSIYPKDWMEKLSGQIKVKRTLQLLGQNNIFAIGDINDIPENKQAVFAQAQAKVAAENISRLVRGRRWLKKYKLGFGTKRTFIFVSVGRNKGAGYFGFFSLGSFFMKRIKSTDLMTKDAWALYRLNEQVPLEIGGPSKGNKLGTVAVTPNLMMNTNAAYNIATRSIEIKPGDAAGQDRMSIASATSLADMYKDDPSRQSGMSQMLVNEDTGTNSMLQSFDGREGGGAGTHSIIKPMTNEEYNTVRGATMDRSKKAAVPNTNGSFNTVPVPNKTAGLNVLSNLAHPGKPAREDVISFVGAGPIQPNNKTA